tara:strand:- start:3093 stop:4100 length:1008 start_codon:yes stop_codon:yes gene_type:complete
VERCATTPERFLDAVIGSSPFPVNSHNLSPTSPQEAFKTLATFLDTARTSDGKPCTFLLDEILELRTFESFPGLRHVLRELLEILNESANHFVLTTRYVQRAHRLLKDGPSQLEVMHIPSLSTSDVSEILSPILGESKELTGNELNDIASNVHALTNGHAGYVRVLGEGMTKIDPHSPDPISTLTALLASEGTLSAACRLSYERRLQRARGYGALKAILDILGQNEGLTLTQISNQLHRTPGSTKDYLSWLEDVDLITSHQKCYSFTDPLLRVWVRLHCHTMPPGPDEVVREVQEYAAERIPKEEPAQAPAYSDIAREGQVIPEGNKQWDIIEID